jgi:hypothetical protein
MNQPNMSDWALLFLPPVFVTGFLPPHGVMRLPVNEAFQVAGSSTLMQKPGQNSQKMIALDLSPRFACGSVSAHG